LEAIQNAGISLQDTPEMKDVRRQLQVAQKNYDRAEKKGNEKEMEAQQGRADGLQAKLARLSADRDAGLADMVYRDGEYVKESAAAQAEKPATSSDNLKP
jgi:hypothetical protein